MAPRRGPRGSVHRRVTRDAQLRQILVFAEGAVTERDYLHGWRKETEGRVAIELNPRPGLAPMTMVQEAIKAKVASDRLERKQGGPSYDAIWCLFDVDNVENIPQVRQLARSNGILLAISNPCIELWFVLHCHDQTAYIEGPAARSESKRLLRCGKHLPPRVRAELIEKYPDARRRAIALEEWHRGNDTPMPANPSSSVWRFVDDVRASEVS